MQMSSIRLLKDHDAKNSEGKPVKHAKGVVISVPFGVGRELIAAGIGMYASEYVEPVAPKRLEPAIETTPKAIAQSLQPLKQK
jgi:hypothetical protein